MRYLAGWSFPGTDTMKLRTLFPRHSIFCLRESFVGILLFRTHLVPVTTSVLVSSVPEVAGRRCHILGFIDQAGADEVVAMY